MKPLTTRAETLRSDKKNPAHAKTPTSKYLILLLYPAWSENWDRFVMMHVVTRHLKKQI